MHPDDAIFKPRTVHILMDIRTYPPLRKAHAVSRSTGILVLVCIRKLSGFLYESTDPVGLHDVPPAAIPISWREVQGFAG